MTGITEADRQYYRKEWERMRYKGCGPVMVFCTALVFVAILLCGCKTRYVTVPEYHTEIRQKTDSFFTRDSVYVKDSTIFLHVASDTLLIERWHTVYRDRWRDRLRVDSFVRTDSVRVPYPVERKLSRWQAFCLDYGKAMLGATAALGAACLLLGWLALRRRRT